MRAPTTVQEVAVSLIDFSPSFTNSLCFVVNRALGVIRSVRFLVSRCTGSTILSNSCSSSRKNLEFLQII
ncbi:unnamed protein product, partial [Prunus brigantina]